MQDNDPILERIRQQAYEQAQASRGGVPPPASPADLAQQCLGDRWLRPPHLELLNRELVAATMGRLREEGYDGLLISLPPGHGKSTLVNQWFSAWFIGAHPTESVISASYDADFAASWGRKSRDILIEHGKQFFGVEVSRNTSAAAWWEIAHHGGGMMTAGVGGALTGKRGRVLILDDFCKNAEEAASPIARQRWWDWYVSTFRTRLEPGGFIAIIATRWHDDDLVGRIIRRMEAEPGGDRFKVIRLPAVAEENDLLGRKPGAPLWPERFDSAALDRIRRNDHRVWNALYQQAPCSTEAATFRREQFHYVDTPLPCVREARYWDIAATPATDGTEHDWTVGAKLGADQYKRVVILDVRRRRGTPEQIEAFIVRTAIEDGNGVAVRIEQEPGSAGKMMVDHFRSILPGFDVQGIPSMSSKVSRAKPIADFAQTGNLILVRGPWNAPLLDELEAFPNGLHDDQVDACSGAFAELSVVATAKPEVQTDADMLRVEPLAYHMGLALYRSWYLSDGMLCCVWFQVEPICGDLVRVKVLLAKHSDADCISDFISQVLETTNKQYLAAQHPRDIVVVPKMPYDAGTQEKMSELCMQKVRARPVRWEPERFNSVFGERLKAGWISVHQGSPTVVQAIRSGCGRKRSGGNAVDSYWEPLARAIIGGIAAAFTMPPPNDDTSNVYVPRPPRPQFPQPGIPGRLNYPIPRGRSLPASSNQL